MKVLVIGNGFDLAHNMRTKYKDFLDFIKQFNDFYELNNRNSEAPIRSGDFINYLVRMFKTMDQRTSLLISELRQYTQDNIWIKHFRSVMSERGENWVDFEKEISEVVRWMEQLFEENDGLKALENTLRDVGSDVLREKNIFINDIITEIGTGRYSSAEKLEQEKITFYLQKLDELIRAFEIYLLTYVDETMGEKTDADIMDLNLGRDDAVISFNYTNTYNKLYKHNQVKAENVHFLHGMAKLDNTCESNNMVMGIDDYHEGADKDVKVKYLGFNKYFQRILKGTDASYKNIFRNNQNEAEAIEHLEIYFFGHSLDVTDKDILREIFESRLSKITVFSYDQKTQQQQVNNLVKVLGRDQVISSAYDSEPKIKFVLQKNSTI